MKPKGKISVKTDITDFNCITTVFLKMSFPSGREENQITLKAV
jgi:hypothetical protein